MTPENLWWFALGFAVPVVLRLLWQIRDAVLSPRRASSAPSAVPASSWAQDMERERREFHQAVLRQSAALERIAEALTSAR